MDAEGLQAENVALRQQIEESRLRELAELREQLAQARNAAAHYKAEAERNAAIGRKIHLESQAEIMRLRASTQSNNNLGNTRPTVEELSRANVG